MLLCFEKSARGDVVSAGLSVIFSASVNYSVQVCTIIGSLATPATTWVLIGIDFVLNTGLCLRIVWTIKRQQERLGNQVHRIQDLVIIELVELYTPVSFLLVTVLAYFGPNGHLIGNILSSQWSFVAIENINLALGNMTMFFFVDLMCMLLSTAMLWIFCKIDLVKFFLVLQEEFFFTFCIILGGTLFLVCILFTFHINFTFIYVLLIHLQFSLIEILFFQLLNQNFITWGGDFGYEFAWINNVTEDHNKTFLLS